MYFRYSERFRYVPRGSDIGSKTILVWVRSTRLGNYDFSLLVLIQDGMCTTLKDRYRVERRCVLCGSGIGLKIIPGSCKSIRLGNYDFSLLVLMQEKVSLLL